MTWNYVNAASTDANNRGIQWFKPSATQLKATLDVDNIRIKKVIVNANTNGSSASTSISVTIGNTSYGKQSISNNGTTSNLDYSFECNDVSNIVVLTLSCNKSLYIKTVTIEYENLAPTIVTFGSDKDNTTVTLANGKLGGDIFKGYTASETTGIAGTIKYESSDTDVATVDEKTGEVTVTGFGTAIITATFTPEDTETYAVTKASYTIVNQDKRANADIAFEEDTYTADFNNDSYDGIKLNNPHGLHVTYTTSSDDLMYENELAVYNKGVCATYTITATFEGNDDYKPATVTCTLNVKDTSAKFETMPIVFDCNTTKGSNTKNGNPDKISESIITISGSDAAFKTTEYRLYKNSTTTISTKIGNIVKIEFVGSSSTYPVSNLKSTEGTYKSGTWTGNAQDVVFTASAQARATKITVTVEVPVAKDLTLDEDQDYHNAAYDNYTVTLKRNLVKDEWNTFCVPFDITEEEAKEAFGDDVKICAFQNATATTVNFKAVTSIKKSKPYLIKPSIDTPADGYKFTLKPINSNAVEVEGTAGSVQMRGTYGPTDITTFAKGNTFAAGLGEDNTILKATSGAQMRGYRAFFLVPTSLEGQTLKANISGIITAIDAIHGVDKADAPVYNLNGQRVTGELKAGIYVKNGKKFIVK